MRYLALIPVVLLLLAGCHAQTKAAGTGDAAANPDAMMYHNDVFNLSGVPYYYLMAGVRNPTLTVQEGDRVTIMLTSTMGTQDLRIDGLGVATQVLAQGESDSVTFIADKKGDFKYYCGVGQHRALGMQGDLIVE